MTFAKFGIELLIIILALLPSIYKRSLTSKKKTTNVKKVDITLKSRGSDGSYLVLSNKMARLAKMVAMLPVCNFLMTLSSLVSPTIVRGRKDYCTTITFHKVLPSASLVELAKSCPCPPLDIVFCPPFRSAFLARLDEVQEELLYSPRRWRLR